MPNPPWLQLSESMGSGPWMWRLHGLVQRTRPFSQPFYTVFGAGRNADGPRAQHKSSRIFFLVSSMFLFFVTRLGLKYRSEPWVQTSTTTSLGWLDSWARPSRALHLVAARFLLCWSQVEPLGTEHPGHFRLTSYWVQV